MSETSRFSINKDLLPVKTTYFFIFAGLATLIPYIPVYAGAIGLSPTEIAIIFSTVSAVSAPSRIFVGITADKFVKHRVILIVCCLLAGIIHCCLLAVPPKNIPHALSQQSIEEIVISAECGAEAKLSACLPPVLTEQLTDENMNDKIHECSLHCCDGSHLNSSLMSTQLLSHMSSLNLTGSAFCPDLNPDEWTLMQLQLLSDKTSPCYNTLNMLVSEPLCQNLNTKRPCYFNCSLLLRQDQRNETNQSTETPCAHNFQRTFWLFYCVYLIAQLALGPVLSLIDGLTFLHLGDKLRNDYGKQRLWGTVAFIILVLATGAIMEKTKNPNEPRMAFVFPFVAFAVFLNMGGGSVCFYKLHSTELNQQENERVVTGTAKKVLALLCNVEMLLLLLLSLMVIGCLSGVQETYFYYFLTLELGATTTCLGVAMFVASVSEMIVLFTSGRLIVALGHDLCIVAAFVAMAVRLFVYSKLYEAWGAVGVELLHCICFGLLYPTVTSLASSLAPQELQGTAQGLIATIYFGFGRALGAAVGGSLYSAVGSRLMFQIFSALSLAYSLILLLRFFIKRCRASPSPSQPPKPQPDGEDEENAESETARLGPNSSSTTQPSNTIQA